MTTPPEEQPTRSSGGVRYPATVCLSFDFDAFSSWLRTDGSNTPGNLSRGEFGNVGARRLLALLGEYDIASTWFVPGHTLDTFPETAAAIVEAGHEIGHHNYAHENPRSLAEAEERRAIERGIAAIERVTGGPPAGYRSPSWDVSASTLRLLVEYGFAYDSSLMSQDFTLYRPRGGDIINAEGPARFGETLPLVEMPIDWSLDDYPYFGLRWTTNLVGLRTPSQVEEVWREEFDWMRGHIDGGVFTLTMHPQVIGRGARLAMLERLLQYLREQPGVTFRRMGDVAAEWAVANA